MTDPTMANLIGPHHDGSELYVSDPTPSLGDVVDVIVRVPRDHAVEAVYLRSTPEELFRRVRHDSKHPLLQVADPLLKLRELFVKRDPLYCRTAHFVIETGRPSVHALVNMILMQLELAGLVDPTSAPSEIDPIADGPSG